MYCRNRMQIIVIRRFVHLVLSSTAVQVIDNTSYFESLKKRESLDCREQLKSDR
jgi:hypothetical protein